MLTRLSPSHVRFGSFEVFYYRNQYDHIRNLADYVINNHYPELSQEPDRYCLWLEKIIDRTARLIAQWQAVGFCHGVMNSDNMSVLGLTLDYGPFAFMEAFDPNFICNHSDHHGRYAYDQQPNIGLFNLSCFAQAILPLLMNADGKSTCDINSEDRIEQAVEVAKEKLESYQPQYVAHYAAQMRAKLGFSLQRTEDDVILNTLLDLMAKDKVDFTILFRRCCYFSSTENDPNSQIRDLFIHRDEFDQWAVQYKQRLSIEGVDDHQRCTTMKRINPKYVLRNYMAENAIRKAEDNKDYSEIDILMKLLQAPYDEHPEFEDYANFPPDWASQISVSCSS
jgi:hypothetical protein